MKELKFIKEKMIDSLENFIDEDGLPSEEYYCIEDLLENPVKVSCEEFFDDHFLIAGMPNRPQYLVLIKKFNPEDIGGEEEKHFKLRKI